MNLTADTVVAWPLKPLSRSAPPAHRVPAGEAAPGARVEIPGARADRPGWTLRAVAQHAERHALQRQAHAAGYGFRVPGYVPTDRDLDLLESLFPGCRVDGVPWEAIRAELECAPPGLIEPRNWEATTAPALLALCRQVRRAIAADEAASRGIAEPETPRQPEGVPDDRGKVSQGDRARLLLLGLAERGEPCPKLRDLASANGVSEATLSKAATALKQHNPRFAKWYQPRQRNARAVGSVTDGLLGVVGVRPEESAMPIEDAQAIRCRIMADPRVQHLREELDKWTDEQWAAVANWDCEAAEQWLAGQADECSAETYKRKVPDGSGRYVERTFVRNHPRVRPG